MSWREGGTLFSSVNEYGKKNEHSVGQQHSNAVDKKEMEIACASLIKMQQQSSFPVSYTAYMLPSLCSRCSLELRTLCKQHAQKNQINLSDNAEKRNARKNKSDDSKKCKTVRFFNVSDHWENSDLHHCAPHNNNCRIFCSSFYSLKVKCAGIESILLIYTCCFYSKSIIYESQRNFPVFHELNIINQSVTKISTENS